MTLLQDVDRGASDLIGALDNILNQIDMAMIQLPVSCCVGLSLGVAVPTADSVVVV